MKVRSLFIVALLALLITGCGVRGAGEKGTEILSANQAVDLLENANTVLVDAQPFLNYKKAHIRNAVNVSRADIVVNTPFPNLLCPPEQLEKIMEKRGISDDTCLVIYDVNKNMDSARLWWTLKIYGHDNVKVVSGGMNALIKQGMETTADIPSPIKGSFSISEFREDMIISKKEIKTLINNPDPHTVIVDTRSKEEYENGTIPGSVHLDFEGNNFGDQTFRPVRQIQIRYLEEGIDYSDTVLLFCKTSIRGAQTYLALFNAGYRNLRLYDGAWVEWSASPANPIFKPESKVFQINESDNS